MGQYTSNAYQNYEVNLSLVSGKDPLDLVFLLLWTLSFMHVLWLVEFQGHLMPYSLLNSGTHQIASFGILLHLCALVFPFMLDRRCPHLAHN
jgi:hypothetical protein